MKKTNKKIIISICIFSIILLLSFSIIIANTTINKENREIDKDKIYYEIKYLDSKIVNMINSLNNINRNDEFYIDWKELQKSTQSIYNYWNSVILDLNFIGIDKNSLTNFGKDLDNLTVSIKNNNKDNTLNNLLQLYNKLIMYSEHLNYNNYNKILLTKYNLLLSCSIAEKGNWTLMHEYIIKSSESIANVVNSMENNKYNQYNINQGYIAVKELENLINIKDIDVFYIKYKIAIERLENI